MKRILIDSLYQHVRVALIDDGELIELLWEDKSNTSIIGNIYVGRIMSVHTGMGAAFVDIGDKKNAYWNYKGKSQTSSKPVNGQEIILQAEKSSNDLKGTLVTDKISFPGKFLVLIPNDGGNIGISQKITSVDEKNRIRNILGEILPEGYGVIVRTQGKGKSKDEFEKEISLLYKKSEDVLNRGKYTKAPALLNSDFSWVSKSLKDLFDKTVDEVIVNNLSDYEEICEFAKEYDLDPNKVKFFEKDIPLFEEFFVESQVRKALNKKVWLKSGGFLIIEQTEAMCVIDVNTGKFTGKSSLQATVLKTNKEAALEVAKQLRLRNLSGIIIVDFIDMKSDEEKDEIKKILVDATAKDRIKTSVVGMTELGLMQITRKKTTPPLSYQLSVNCKHCGGSGTVISTNYIVGEMKNQVVSLFSQTNFSHIKIVADERLLNMFAGKNNSFVNEIQNKYNKKIQLEHISDKPYGYYEIIKEGI